MYIAPMMFMVFYVFAIGISSFVVRYRAIKNKEIKISLFRTYEMDNKQVPEKVIIYGRHFDNQFQLPVLYLITLAVAQTVQLYDGTILKWIAWAFIASRILHSYIHLGSNNVRHRMLAYFFGWLCVLAMWIVIEFQRFV